MSDYIEPADTADLLARAYIDLLAKAENVKAKSMLAGRLLADPNPVISLLDDLDGGAPDDGPRLRVDLAMAAVLTAKAIAGEADLARRLRHGAPVVTIETHTADLVPLVTTIIEDCACVGNRGRHVVSRDGSEKAHAPERGNTDVIASLNSRKLTLGIAADVRHHLPSSLLRTAEYKLSIPAIDGWAIRLVIEAVTGDAAGVELDDDLIRVTRIEDLSLAVRSGLSPAECIARLRKVVLEKTAHVGDGPGLDELHGYGEAVAWAKNLVADFADFKAGRIEWDDVDTTALLLAGPPGTGKTAFASAVAKSAGVPLIATSVAQWNASNYLSGTLQAIRAVFGEARRQAPCILLIDEIDGISDRSTIRGEYAEYWMQIVNCLLECLDGTVSNPGVCVIATTNYPDRIDPALGRSSRLDREIVLEKPNAADLCAIFRYYLGENLLASGSLMPMALAAHGKTGADVEAFVRRAKSLARRARREMTPDDLLGEIHRGHPILSPEARRRIAVHEAGHILIGRCLQVGNFVGASIHDAGGQAEFIDVIDLSLPAEAMKRLACLFLGGRAAEAVVLGDIALGSAFGDQSDLARATAAIEMVETKCSSNGGGVYLPGDFATNIRLLPGLVRAVSEGVLEQENRARAILEANRPSLEALAIALEERSYLSPNDADEILANFNAQSLEAAE